MNEAVTRAILFSMDDWDAFYIEGVHKYENHSLETYEFYQLTKDVQPVEVRFVFLEYLNQIPECIHHYFSTEDFSTQDYDDEEDYITDAQYPTKFTPEEWEEVWQFLGTTKD